MEENKKPEDIKPEELKGMRRFEIPKIWLEKFKLQINRPYNDKDSLFEVYLKNATVYIFTQYLETPPNKLHLVNFENIYDNIVHAIFNVATTYEQNPDINLINDYGSVVDSNMIYRILGPFTEYFKSYRTSEWVNIFEYDTSLPNPTVDDILAKIKDLNLTIENVKVVSNNAIDRTNELKQELHDFAAYIEPKIPKPEQFDEIKNKVVEFRDKLNDQEVILGDVKRKQEKVSEKIADIETKTEENKAAIDLSNTKNTEQDTAIENLKNRVDGIVIPDVSRFAVKDAKNTFTTSQLIQGHLESNGLYKEGSSQDIAKIKNQGEKALNFLFEQQTFGFRNYCNINLQHKYGNTNPVDLLKIQTKNTGEGIFLQTENNKLAFLEPTTINNVDTPTNDLMVANKKYVDDKVANIPTPPAVDLSPINDEINALKTKTDTTNENLANLNNQAAKKDVNNEFINQTIKGNTAFISFTGANNTRRGYIGKSSSTNNDIELKAETNSLNINAKHHININAGSGYQVTTNQVPSANTSIVNKKYVDDAIAAIPTPPAVDLTPINDEIDALKTKTDTTNTSVANIETRLTNLSNVAVKNNIENRFTTHQQINGFVKSSLGLYKDAASATILTLKNQGEKKQFIDFIQNTNQGFRNYCNFGIRIKYGNQNDSQFTTLFNIQTKNTGEGIFLSCENNKLAFLEPTTINNVDTPTNDLMVANKKYVDDKVANISAPDLSEYTRNDANNNFTGFNTFRNYLNIEETRQNENKSAVNVEYLNNQSYARTNSSNTFIAETTFNNTTTMRGDLYLAALPTVTDANAIISSPQNLVTKDYVDQNTNAYYAYPTSFNARINKRDITNNLWYYIVPGFQFNMVDIPEQFWGKKVLITLELHDIKAPSEWKVCKIFAGIYSGVVNPNDGSLSFSTGQFGFTFHWDLKPGMSGDFTTLIQFHIGLVKVCA